MIMLVAQVLIVAWLLRLVGVRSRVVATLVSLLVLVPVHAGVPPAMALRGLWGDPSITAVQLLVLALVGKAPKAFREGWRAPAVIAVSAAALYASALGPWNLDFYRFGYQPAALVTVLGAIALIAWWRGQPLYLYLLAIDLAAWRAGVLESTNLWDALLDPLLMCAMLALALRNGRRAMVNRSAQPEATSLSTAAEE
jgi:hypothetical protein